MLPTRIIKRTFFLSRRYLSEIDFKSSPNVIASCEDLIESEGKRTLKVHRFYSYLTIFYYFPPEGCNSGSSKRWQKHTY